MLLLLALTTVAQAAHPPSTRRVVLCAQLRSESVEFSSAGKKMLRMSCAPCRCTRSVGGTCHSRRLFSNHGRQIDYVVVVFGGAAAYFDDDMNKLLWMAQAAGAAAPQLLTDHGEFRVDTDGSAALHRCLLYRCPSHESRALCCAQKMCRLSYHRFGSLRQGVPARVRAQHLLTLCLVQDNALLGDSTVCEGLRSGRKTSSWSM
jgi:hypothetical protein